MTTQKIHAVTGAFGYTGKYIAKQLLADGRRVITLTNNPQRANPFGTQVKAIPFNFADPAALAASLAGVDTLYNTYWVRFDHGRASFTQAVANTRTLVQAAVQAGVRRFVHISITNPDPQSSLGYFRGKGQLEQAIQSSGISYAILRPAVIFGQEDILINNIAWLLRRFPLFAIPGDGKYRLQPIYVEDLAALAVQAGAAHENQIIQAIGPETFTFNDLVGMLAAVVGSRARLVHLPPSLAYWLSKLVGVVVGDVILTREEVLGLMDNLLVAEAPPAGHTRLSESAAQNSATLGTRYAHEIKRHYKLKGIPAA
ncbi:MAG: NAD(P)H-binding protein [Anaerolineae bacterium]|nr:NAD(P)H-binding protein [Anaerolineae bacterium]